MAMKAEAAVVLCYFRRLGRLSGGSGVVSRDEDRRPDKSSTQASEQRQRRRSGAIYQLSQVPPAVVGRCPCGEAAPFVIQNTPEGQKQPPRGFWSALRIRHCPSVGFRVKTRMRPCGSAGGLGYTPASQGVAKVVSSQLNVSRPKSRLPACRELHLSGFARYAEFCAALDERSEK